MKSKRTQANIVEPKNPKLLVKVPKKTTSIGINTDLTFQPFEIVRMVNDSHKISFISDDEGKQEDDLDTSSQSEETNYEEIDETKFHDCENLPSKDMKCIVFWSCIAPLLSICQACYSKAKVSKASYKGTMLIAKIICTRNHHTTWYSQGMSTGNLVVAASILFSGNTYQRIKEMMNIANILFMSHTTYDRIQKRFLFPAYTEFSSQTDKYCLIWQESKA